MRSKHKSFLSYFWQNDVWSDVFSSRMSSLSSRHQMESPARPELKHNGLIYLVNRELCRLRANSKAHAPNMVLVSGQTVNKLLVTRSCRKKWGKLSSHLIEQSGVSDSCFNYDYLVLNTDGGGWRKGGWGGQKGEQHLKSCVPVCQAHQQIGFQSLINPASKS